LFFPALGKKTDPASYRHDIFVFLKICDFCRNPVGEHQIVLIQAADILAAGFGQGKVERACQSFVVRELVEPDTFVFLFQPVANFPAVIA